MGTHHSETGYLLNLEDLLGASACAEQAFFETDNSSGKLHISKLFQHLVCAQSSGGEVLKKIIISSGRFSKQFSNYQNFVPV